MWIVWMLQTLKDMEQIVGEPVSDQEMIYMIFRYDYYD